MDKKNKKKCKDCGIIIGEKNRTGLCLTCYRRNYIKNRWKNNSEYRKQQSERINNWIKRNPTRWKEICKKSKSKYIKNKKNA